MAEFTIGVSRDIFCRQRSVKITAEDFAFVNLATKLDFERKKWIVKLMHQLGQMQGLPNNR